MKNKIKRGVVTVKVYHGYGHEHNLNVSGHVLAGKPTTPSKYSNNPIRNILHLVKLFLVKPVPFVPLRLHWESQQFQTKTGKDGFFKFEWTSNTFVPAGWHSVTVDLLDAAGGVAATGVGKIFVPHSTQYAFISDIDDTVLVSHSATTGKRLKVLFTKNPRSRKTFADLARYYHLLSIAHTEASVFNPFFYVSSSEWNLYEDLNEFFKHNELPKGAFLLSPIKKWHQLFKTGQTKHQGKLVRIVRIMETFPKQRFVLLGDNSQKDPEIYATIANKYPDNVVAIYLRNIRAKKERPTRILLESITNKSIYTCLFKHTNEAIAHSREIGLIE